MDGVYIKCAGTQVEQVILPPQTQILEFKGKKMDGKTGWSQSSHTASITGM